MDLRLLLWAAGAILIMIPPSGAGTSNVLITCPMQSITETRSINVKSLEPVSQRTQKGTVFVSWLYPGTPNASQGAATCDQGTSMILEPGQALTIPGSTGTTVKLDGRKLSITSGGSTGYLDVSEGAQVVACTSGQVNLVQIIAAGSIVSELAINFGTGCIGTHAVSVASIQGATSAEITSDPNFAKRAGLPLPRDIVSSSALPPAEAPLSKNPCLGKSDTGFSTGLGANFFRRQYSEDANTTDAFPLTFTGPPSFMRCDCPNQKTGSTPWPGEPPLPADSFVNNYGVSMKGQFLVTRPVDGVKGESKDLFPLASDYHLACLQHDDSAEMLIDDTSYYLSDSFTGRLQGFKQYCVPVSLTPGWHDIELRYGKSPLGQQSIYRFFLIDAAEVSVATSPDGTESYDIEWQGSGNCCTGSGPGAIPACIQPLDCCRFRTSVPCKGGQAPASAPALGTAGNQTPQPLPGLAALPAPVPAPFSKTPALTPVSSPSSVPVSISPQPSASPTVALAPPHAVVSPTPSIGGPTPGIAPSPLVLAPTGTQLTGSSELTSMPAPGPTAVTPAPMPPIMGEPVPGPLVPIAVRPVPLTPAPVPVMPPNAEVPTPDLKPPLEETPAPAPPHGAHSPHSGTQDLATTPVVQPPVAKTPVPAAAPIAQLPVVAAPTPALQSPEATMPNAPASDMALPSAPDASPAAGPDMNQSPPAQAPTAVKPSHVNAPPFAQRRHPPPPYASPRPAFPFPLTDIPAGPAPAEGVVPLDSGNSPENSKPTPAAYPPDATPAEDHATPVAPPVDAPLSTPDADFGVQVLRKRQPPPPGGSTACLGFPSSATASIDRIIANGDGVASVSFSVSVSVLPSEGIAVPLFANITTVPGVEPVQVNLAGPTSVAGTASVYVIKDVLVPLKDAYQCLETQVQISAILAPMLPGSFACDTIPINIATSYCHQPVCQLYAVDMAFCGEEGLVTDKSSARIVFVCSQGVDMCGECWSVNGPSRGHVDYFGNAAASNSSYELQVSWESGYRGPVSMSVEPTRAAGGCELHLREPATCGGWTQATSAGPLMFTAKDYVQVRSVAYKIVYDCTGPSCAVSF